MRCFRQVGARDHSFRCEEFVIEEGGKPVARLIVEKKPERTVAATAVPGGDWWEALDKIRTEQAIRRPVPRSAEEIDAEINALRDEWEEPVRP